MTTLVKDNITPALIGHAGAPVCEGRLTLASGVPVTVTDQTAKTTVYFTPYKGSRIGLYDGSKWLMYYQFTEVSVAVPSTTNTPFDIFAYDNNGSLTLETANWSNDTTRATSMVSQDGVYLKSGDTTRRYLGTGRTTGVNGQCEASVTKRFLWNYYNRIERQLYKLDATSHTYNTATYRIWNNTATNIVEFVCGAQEDILQANIFGGVAAAAAGSIGYINVGLDATNAAIVNGTSVGNSNAQLVYGGAVIYAPAPAAGYHYLAMLEYGNASNAPTFSLATLQGLFKM